LKLPKLQQGASDGGGRRDGGVLGGGVWIARRLRGRSNIAQARETLLALDPSFSFHGELRAMASVSNQVVAEYRRPASEMHRASSRRLFVCLIEENGLVASVRVVLERRFWTVRK